jgi:hypothetical protein
VPRLGLAPAAGSLANTTDSRLEEIFEPYATSLLQVKIGGLFVHFQGTEL